MENAERLLLDLVDAGHLVPMGIDGMYGRGAAFEDTLLRFDAYISRSAKDDGATLVRFPPVINRRDFERSGYLKSFPHLAGTVFSFDGTPAEHQHLLETVEAGGDWSATQKMTGAVLCPAACYPIYPTLRGTLPQNGRLFDVFSYCFRHEPSKDPARMQIFRMREFVRISDGDSVRPWRNMWIERAMELLTAIGLPAVSAVANDPFFGRGGRMLAANQRAQELKFELVVPIASEESPTAIMSFNYHQEHFGSTFGIQTSDGAVAQTACVGFGMERVTLALFKYHGMRVDRWPDSVRRVLWG